MPQIVGMADSAVLADKQQEDNLASKCEEHRAARRARVLAMFQKGMKVAEIAKALRCTVSVIYADLLAVGIDAATSGKECITREDIAAYRKKHGVGSDVRVERVYYDTKTGHQKSKIINAKILEVHTHNALTTAGNFRWPDLIIAERESA